MRIQYIIKEYYYTVRSWFKRYTTIKPRALTHRYCDAVELLPHCMFEVFCKFMEKEVLKDCIVDWDYDDKHKIARMKMQEIYDWWTKEYIPYFNNENEEYEELFKKIEHIVFSDLLIPIEGTHTSRYSPEETLSKKDFELMEETYDRISKIDNLMDQNKKKYMHELVDIVDFLWT